MSIKVSIIIPIYNVSDYVKRCMKSVMHQSYDNIECIVVDDCSPDDSIAKCEKMIADYHGPINFTILHHQCNRGLSAARNTGTDAATGDYILYLDSDDELTSDCIEKLVRPLLNDPTIEMVIGEREDIPDGCPIPPYFKKNDISQELDLTSNEAVRQCYFDKNIYYVNAWNKLIKKNFLTRNQLYFMEGLLWEDIMWTFFVMKHLCHLYIVSDVTYLRYMRPQSIVTSTSIEKRENHFIKIYSTIANNFTEGKQAQEAKYYYKKVCGRCIRNPKNQTVIQSAKLFRKALAEEHYSKEAFVLSVMLFLAKTVFGRVVFSIIVKRKELMDSQKMG